MSRAVAAKIRQRLKRFVKEEYGSQYEFVQAEGISSSTAGGWFGAKSRVPDVPSLRPLIQRGLSLDWLFTGEGYPRRIGASAGADPSEVFRSVVLAHLPASPSAKQSQHRRALALMKDLKRHPDDDGIANFAIQAVQRQFATLIESLDSYDRLMEMVEDPYRRDSQIAELVEELVRASGPEADLDEFERARQQLEARRKAGQARANKYFLDRIPSGETDPATVCFRKWLEVAEIAVSPDTQATGKNDSPPED